MSSEGAPAPAAAAVAERALAGLPLLCRALFVWHVVGCVVTLLVPVLPWLLSFCPAFVLRGGLWRLATSFLAPRGVIETALVCYLVHKLLAGFERELGSFGLLVFILGHSVVVNTSYLAAASALLAAGSGFSASAPSEFAPCSSPSHDATGTAAAAARAQGGLLPFLLAVLVVMVLRAPQQRLSFCGLFDVDKRLYPLLLLLVMFILGGNPLYDGISMAIGYCYHAGALRHIMPSAAKLGELEGAHPRLREIASRPGFVAASEAAGAGDGTLLLPTFMSGGNGAGGNSSGSTGGFLSTLMHRTGSGAVGGIGEHVPSGASKSFRGPSRRLGDSGGGSGAPSGGGAHASDVPPRSRAPKGAQAPASPPPPATATEDVRAAALAAAERRSQARGDDGPVDAV